MQKVKFIRGLADGMTALILVTSFVLLVRREVLPASTQQLDFSLAKDSVVRPVAVRLENSEGTFLFGAENNEDHLVFLFRSDCEVCMIQQREWIRVSAVAIRRGITVVALTPESGDATVFDYFPTEASGVKVGRIENPRQAFSNFGTTIVPTTLLINGAGKVVYQWKGLMSDEAADALRRSIEEVSSPRSAERED